MTPTRAPVTPAMTVEAETSDRSFQMCGVTSGSATLRSISANATSSATAAAAEPTVVGAVQPWLLVLCDGVDQQQQSSDEGDGARHVQAAEPGALGAALGYDVQDAEQR